MKRFGSVQFNGKALKQFRLERGLTADELAEIMGISKETVYRQEKFNSSPNGSLVFGYSLLLGKPFEQFFIYKDDNEPEPTPETESVKLHLRLVGVAVPDNILVRLSSEELTEAKEWAKAEFLRGGHAQNPPAFLGNVHIRE